MTSLSQDESEGEMGEEVVKTSRFRVGWKGEVEKQLGVPLARQSVKFSSKSRT